MKQIVAKLYEITPDIILKKLAGQNRLRSVKDFLLKENGNNKIIRTKINKAYNSHFVEFDFYAPIKIALKAKKRGMENTLLRHSFSLLSLYKSESNLTIYDVGANYGFLSMVWGKAFYNNGGTIHSFEPSPTVSKVTQKSFTSNNLENINFYKQAVGNINGHIEIYDGKTTSNTLKINDSKPVKVKITTLDEFTTTEKIEKIDLIKIDVDGIEFEILQGALGLIKKHKPIFIVETNDDMKILDFFHSNGYTILDMDLKIVQNKDIIPSNIFCVETNEYKKTKLA